MSKPHQSISPTFNLLLLFIWGAAAALLLFVVEPHAPIMIAMVGAALGAISGVMQHLSLRQATAGFLAATTLLEVRSALHHTPWGVRYLRFLYFSQFVLFVVAIALIRRPMLAVIFGYAAGYFSLMFVREVITLRDTYRLRRLSLAQTGSDW